MKRPTYFISKQVFGEDPNGVDSSAPNLNWPTC